MFSRHDVTLMSNPVCRNAAPAVAVEDFQYYDKDGFELSRAEQKFYLANSLPLHDILNHRCWQKPWFELEARQNDLILDHSMFLCRASYEDLALRQLEDVKKTIPTADLMIRTRQKWGFDFALDAVAEDGTVYEVLHIEYDNYDFITFREQMLIFDVKVRHTDWGAPTPYASMCCRPTGRATRKTAARPLCRARQSLKALTPMLTLKPNPNPNCLGPKR